MFLSELDLISPKITLYYKNQTRHHTIFSGVLTLIAYGMSIAFSIYFFIEFVKKDNPSSFLFNKYIEDVGLFPLNSSSMFHFISFSNKDVDFNAVTIIGVSESASLLQGESNTTNLKQMIHWLYEKCELDDIKGIENLIINKTKFLNGACIRKIWDIKEQKYYTKGEKNFFHPYLKKGASHSENVKYGVIIEKCRQDIPETNHKCLEEKKIEEFYLYQGIEINIIDNEIDVSNYSSPVKKFIYTITNGMFNDTFTQNHLNYNPALVRTHSGFFFDSLKEEVSYAYYKNEKITTLTGKSRILCAFYFWMQNRLQIYDRSYRKIQDILAKIGGVINVIFSFSFLINSFFHDFNLMNDTRKLYNNNLIEKFNESKKVREEKSIPLILNGHERTKRYSLIIRNSEPKLIKIPRSSNESNQILKKISFFEFFKYNYLIFCRKKKSIWKKTTSFRQNFLSEQFFCKLYFHFEKQDISAKDKTSAPNLSRLNESKIYLNNYDDAKF